MTIASTDVTEFTEYIDNYKYDDSQFPPVILAKEQFSYPRTTNGPELFHSNYKQQFYKQHPKKETKKKQKFVKKCWATSEVEKNILNYLSKKLGPRFA